MCMVGGTKYTIAFPGKNGLGNDAARAWGLSHFVKHVLIERDLGLPEMIGITGDLESFRNMLKQYKCRLLRDKSLLDHQKNAVCRECAVFPQCFASMQVAIDRYVDYMKQVVRRDSSRPRHVHFCTDREKNNLAFVDDMGCIVVTHKQRTRIVLKTGYRPRDDYANAHIMAAHLKNAFPGRYYLNRAKQVVRLRIQINSWKQAQLVTTENWQ